MKGGSLKDQGFTKFKSYEHHTSKRTAEIKVHKSRGTFGCEIGDMQKIGTLPEVEKWAHEFLKKKETVLLDWKPVIRAKVSGTERWGYRRGEREENDQREVKVEIMAERFYIARASRDPDGREVWRSLTWEKADPDSPEKVPETEMVEHAQKFREPRDESRSYFNEKTPPAQMKGWVRLPEREHGQFLIEYNEELWKGIQHVIDVIENEEKILSELFATTAGRDTLAKIGSQPELLRLTSGS